MSDTRNLISSDSLIKSRVESLEHYKRELATMRHWKRQLTNASKFMNAIRCRFDKADLSAWTDVRPWLGQGAVTLTVSLTQRATSMKVGEVPKIIGALLEAGFEPDTTTDYANASLREFRFTRAFDEPREMIQIKVILNVVLEDAPDATCRRVQVGSETKEVPIYKLVCED